MWADTEAGWKKNAPQLYTDFEAAMSKTGVSSKTHGTEVTKNVEQMGSSITASAVSHAPDVPKAIESAMTHSVTSTKTHGADISKTVEQMGVTNASSAKTHSPEVSSAVSAAMVKAASETVKHGTAVTKSIDKMGADSATSAKTHAPEVPAAMDASLLSLVKLGETHGKEFSTGTDKMLKDAETFLKQAKPRWTTSGEQVMLGLLAGLKKEKPSLDAEAKSIAAGIESALNTALKIKSPSELTAEMGEHLISGLGVGIQRGTGSAATLAAGAALQVAGRLGGDGAQHGAGGVGSTPVTIVIQMDGREIGRASAEYLHGQTTLLAKIN